MSNVKDKIKQDVATTKTVVKNVAEFVDAVALTAVSVYSIFEGLHHKTFWYRALLVAGVLIALQAFVLLVRHFNK